MALADPTTFWGEPVAPGACAAMVAKYDALAALEALPAGPRRDRAIRRAAARWPGSLRESQLAGPAVCCARREAALIGARAPARTRGWWCATDPALPLWIVLHPLLGDLTRWRRGLARGVRARPEALVAFLSESPQSARWDPAAVAELVGERVQIRVAYRWLARRSGLPIAVLSRVLVHRSGRWERRSDDPPGPDPAGLPIEIARFFPLQSDP
ncbi:MAG: hypothetical protein R3A79_04055 [Nannocystaceae bacterium]